MKVKIDGLTFCADCTIYAANGDLSGIDDDARADEVTRAVDSFGPHLVYDKQDDGETFYNCDACGERCFGTPELFAVLEEGN